MKIYILQYAYGTHLERSSSVRGAKERARETGGDSILCLGRLAAFYVLIFPETQLHERAKQQSTTTDTHSATPFQIYINTMDNSASQNRCGSCIRALRMLFSYCAGIFHHAPQRPPPDSAPAPTDPLRCGCASLRTPGASSELWTALYCCVRILPTSTAARATVPASRLRARTHRPPALRLRQPADPGSVFRALDVAAELFVLCSPQHTPQTLRAHPHGSRAAVEHACGPRGALPTSGRTIFVFCAAPTFILHENYTLFHRASCPGRSPFATRASARRSPPQSRRSCRIRRPASARRTSPQSRRC